MYSRKIIYKYTKNGIDNLKQRSVGVMVDYDFFVLGKWKFLLLDAGSRFYQTDLQFQHFSLINWK